MRYIIEKKADRVISFLLDDAGHAVEIHVDDPAQGPKIGDIYIGLVQKVAKNINAAFVEIIPGINGYLPFDEIVAPIYTSKGPSPDIQAGDQLVVQITREAFGNKDMSLTTKITMQGKHVVLVHGGVGLGVSKKIGQDIRQDLKDRILTSEEFAHLQKRIGPCGLVVRTSAGELFMDQPHGTGAALPKDPEKDLGRATDSGRDLGKATDSERELGKVTDSERNLGKVTDSERDSGKADASSWNAERQKKLKQEVLRDIEDLEAQMADIRLKAPYRSVHTSLKKQPPRWLSRILRLSGRDVEAVITDDNSLYRQMLRAADESGKKDLAFRLYSDSLVSMEKVYSLEREMERALCKKVNLKSGGDLVIESTEALHIIDVNSGRFQGGKQKEEALLSVNLEAAREAARQIRLRNLSGIIVIDFINLKKQKNSLRILEELRRAAASDPVRTQVVDMTKLGLVEMTRQKIEAPLTIILLDKSYKKV